MSSVTFYGHGIWCYTCQTVYNDTGDCEHSLQDKAGVQKGRDGYFAQPNDMGHLSPHMYHEIDGFEQCVECSRVKIPDDLVGDGGELVTDGGSEVQGVCYRNDCAEPAVARWHDGKWTCEALCFDHISESLDRRERFPDYRDEVTTDDNVTTLGSGTKKVSVIPAGAKPLTGPWGYVRTVEALEEWLDEHGRVAQ